MKTTSARNKLLDRFGERKAAGSLFDIKFYLGGAVQETTVENVCDEVMRILDAIDAGVPVKARHWNDSQKVA